MMTTIDEIRDETYRLLGGEDGRYKAGFKDGWEQCAEAMAQQQLLNKGSVMRCKEFLEQKLKEEENACVGNNRETFEQREHFYNCSNLRNVIKMISEPSAL